MSTSSAAPYSGRRELDGDVLANLAILLCPSESQWKPCVCLPSGIYYGMTNYMGNYGGPGPISLMSGTIIPANNS